MSLTGTQSPDAACAAPGVDPELFTSTRHHDIAAAKAVCATCPIAKACLAAALERGEAGVWGGMTEDERLGLTRRKSGPKRRPVNHGTLGGYHTHRKRGEVACIECKAAANAYTKQRRIQRQQAQTQRETTS